MVVPSRLPLLIAIATIGVGCSQYASTDGPEHCGAIGDQIWGKDFNPHDVTCDVTITGDLTIGPSAKVRFAPDTVMIVQGSLSIEGTEDNPVLFEAADQGSGWAGIWVRPWEEQEPEQRPNPHADDAPRSVPQGQVSIDWLEINDAGVAPNANAYARPASIVVDRGPVHMADVVITGSRQCGISVGRDGRFDNRSGRINVASSNQAGLCVHAEAVSHLPETVEIPDESVIDVFGSAITGRHEWPNRGTPYRITENLTVAYADLTLRPGVEVEIDPDVRLKVGTGFDSPTYGAKDYRSAEGPLELTRSARLHAEGSSSAPVTIRAASVGGEDSRFDRIEVTGENNGHAEAVFEHTTIIGGGAALNSDPATLHIKRDGMVTLKDVTFDTGGGAALRIEDGATITEDSENVTVTGHAYVASAHPNGAIQLPTAGSTYTGNDAVTQLPRASGDIVYIDDETFTRTGTLADLGVEYVAEGNLLVEDPDTVGMVLTIEPGVTMRFPAGSRLSAGNRDAVTLLFGDTAGDEVLLSLADTEEEESAWVGLEVGTGVLEGSRLSNVRVTGAGQDATFGAAVEVLSANLLVDGLTIEDSQARSLLLKGTFAEGSKDLTIRNSGTITALVSLDSVASLPEEGADLADNPEPFVRMDGILLSRSGTWGDLGVPYFIDNQMQVGGRVDADDNVTAARLTVEPGTTILFDDRGAIRTEVTYNSNETQAVPATLELVGTEADPILLTPRDPEIGWTGIVLRGDDVEPDPAKRSHLENVILEYAGAIFSFAAITYDDSTPIVNDVTIRYTKRYGVSLIDDAFVEDPFGERYELYDPSVYTFVDNYTNCVTDPEDPCPDDPNLIDFRVFVNPRP